MPEDIKRQPFWEKLSFACKVLTEEVFFEKQKKINNKELERVRLRRGISFILLAAIIGLYFGLRYRGNLLAVAMIILAVDYPLDFIVKQMTKKKDDAYDKKKNSLMKAIGSTFCSCGSKCNCRDQYIEYMYEHGINLTD